MGKATRQARLVVTMGDPAGIGSEVVLKALTDPLLAKEEITVVGTRSLFNVHYHQLQKQLGGGYLVNPDSLNWLEVPLAETITNQISIGVGNAASGAASFAYLEEAMKRTLAGEFDGIITAPIAKFCWQAAGYNYPGQTEVLATKAGVNRYGMLFVAQSPHTGWMLRTLLATTHIPLNQVSNALNPELMSLKLDLLLECLHKDFGISQPTIAIAGLNPHSGESGKLGTEEQTWLFPWLASAKKQYPHAQLIGLIPPDTMWVKPGEAWYRNPQQTNLADAYLALYHDQGLIPVKLMAFDQAINTTIGLPFIRTSPDHGTAFEIAGQGIAREDSMRSAIILAIELATQRLNSRLL